MIQPVGYFKIWRELFSKPIWLNSTPEQKAILITLIAMANFNGKEWEWKGEKFKAAKGQFVTSIESIRNACGKGITVQNVRTSLDRFEKLGFLTNESTKTGRLITILNWHLYQDCEDETNKESNNKLTKTSQRGNKELTPREERKKDKKDKNNIYSELISSFTSEPELIKAINDFVEMRNKIKKPMTERALQLLFGKLQRLSPDSVIQIKILEQSILKNWQDVYPLKEEPKDKKSAIDEWVMQGD